MTFDDQQPKFYENHILVEIIAPICSSLIMSDKIKDEIAKSKNLI